MIKKLRKLLSSKDTDFTEVIKHSFWAFFMLGIAAFIQLLFDFLLARRFGATGVGLFYLSFSFVFMLSLLGRLGFNKAVVKYIPSLVSKDSSAGLYGLKQSAEQMALLLSLPIALAIFLSANVISTRFFSQPELATYLRYFSIMLPMLSLLYIRTGFMSGLKLVKESVFIERAAVNAIAIIGIVIFGSRFGIQSAVVGSVVGVYISALAASAFIRSKLPPKNDIKAFDKRILIAVAFPLLFVDFANQMTGQLNVLILGGQASVDSVGIFSTALKVSTMIGLILTAINAITTTKFSEIFHRKDTKKLEEIASKSAALATLCGLPLIIGFMIFPRFILGLFGSEFTSGDDALRILVVAQAVNIGFGSVVQILSMSGHQKQLAYATVSSVLVFNVILSLVLVPIYGINGAAAAVGASIILKNIILLIMIKKYLNIWSLPFIAIKSWAKAVIKK